MFRNWKLEIRNSQHFTPGRQLGMILSLLVIIIAGLWFTSRGSVPAAWLLEAYAPEESWLALNFGSGEALQALTQQQPRVARTIDEKLRQLGLTQELLDQAEQLTLVGLIMDRHGRLPEIAKGAEIRFRWAWLLRTSDLQRLELVVPRGTFLRQLGPEVVVWSVDEAVGRSFRSAQQRLRPQSKTDKEIDTLWSGFINPYVLANGLGLSAGEDVVGQVLKAWLQGQPEMAWRIGLRDKQLVIEVGRELRRASRQQLPVRVMPSTDLYVSGIELAQVMKQLENTVAQALPFHNLKWRQMMRALELDYGIGQDKLAEIIQGEATLSVALDRLVKLKSLIGLTDLLKLSNMKIVLDLAEAGLLEQREAWQELGQRAVARLEPMPIQGALPDGTKAAHLVADLGQYGYSELEDVPGSFYLNIPSKDQEIVLTEQRDHLIISNASSTVYEYLDEAKHADLPGCASGGKDDELIYLSRDALSVFRLLDGFQSAIINIGDEGMTVCLGL